jgi:hypothetical protein
VTFRCAELSSELEEPLAGTAPVARRWELVERAKPWGRDPGLKVEGAKVLLVHRLGSGSADLAHGRRYLVCTNGARDPCCAIRGPAVAQALDRVRPGQVYECSHLGGHRFAANLLVLPEGLVFGRLDARAALALVDELDEGRLPLDHLRGRSAYDPERQAAEILVRGRLGVTRLDDLRPTEDGAFVLSDGRRAIARLRSETLGPIRVSCRDEKTEAPVRWTLEELVLA